MLFRKKKRKSLIRSVEHTVYAFIGIGLLNAALKASEEVRQQKIATYHDEISMELINRSSIPFVSVTLRAYGKGKLLKEHVLKRPDGLITPKTVLICGFNRKELEKLAPKDCHFFLSVQLKQKEIDFNELDFASISYLSNCKVIFTGEDPDHLNIQLES